MILLPIYVLNPNFIEDFKTQILKFEAKKKKKKDIIIIDYCRFIVRERNLFRERKWEVCVWREEEKKREKYVERERERERESQREQYVERETTRAIRRVVERDNQSKGSVTTGRAVPNFLGASSQILNWDPFFFF